MKKFCIILSTIILTLTLSGTTFAKYKSGYEVVSTTEEIVIIKNKNGEEIEVPARSKRFYVGDNVLYEAEKNKIRQEVEG